MQSEEIKKIAAGLSPLERVVVPFLDDKLSFDALISRSKLKDVEVMRALQWLENKGALKINTAIKEVIELDSNGEEYLNRGLPEKRFLKALTDKPTDVKKVQKAAGISDEEVSICLGVLRSKAAIGIAKTGDVLAVSITDAGKKIAAKESLEEALLKKRFPIELNSLSPEERFAFDNLKKRKKIVKSSILKLKTIELTELGKKLKKEKIEANVVERLTPDLLKTDAWKSKKFREYDVKINVPKVFFGRKQHYRAFLDEVREKFLSLGFMEMKGPIVESDFWDMDALFMPQFHSARDIHDAYYIKSPEYAKLDEKIVEKVRQAHESGFNTGSKGWQYKFDLKRTHRQLLRTQGTACSARTLASADLKVPGKYFGITRCFRQDVIDATHNVDFNQTEGIVVEENLNFRHLVGLLKMFAKEFAETDQIKIVPSYFPFTEPSCELFAKHPQLGWIELGGAGIFRPEVVKPLAGKNLSVLAWGLGIDRLAMFKLGIKDIRQLFSHDLDFLRNAKVV